MSGQWPPRRLPASPAPSIQPARELRQLAPIAPWFAECIRGTWTIRGTGPDRFGNAQQGLYIATVTPDAYAGWAARVMAAAPELLHLVNQATTEGVSPAWFSRASALIASTTTTTKESAA